MILYKDVEPLSNSQQKSALKLLEGIKDTKQSADIFNLCKTLSSKPAIVIQCVRNFCHECIWTVNSRLFTFLYFILTQHLSHMLFHFKRYFTQYCVCLFFGIQFPKCQQSNHPIKETQYLFQRNRISSSMKGRASIKEGHQALRLWRRGNAGTVLTSEKLRRCKSLHSKHG